MKIFLIVFDTLRKDHTGKIYGNNWIQTQNFDEFAKDCLIFDKAYPESLPTIPVRRAIHTGIRTFPFNHKKPKLRTDDIVQIPGWFPIPPNQTHLAEYLNQSGYITSFITSTYHYFKPNMNFHLGFNQWNWIRGHEGDYCRAGYRGPSRELKKKIKEHLYGNSQVARFLHKRVFEINFKNVQDRKIEEDYFPAQTFNKAIEYIRDTVKNRNTFCFIDEFDPHEPWDPPQNYLDLYLDKNYSGPKAIDTFYSENVDQFISPDELKYMRANYAGEVSLCDNWFGVFINELKALEIYDDSLIILTSDHGHSIGEHNATGKLPTYMYPELVDLPFMIKPPGNINGPKRIKIPYVYHHDIPPTIFGFIRKSIPNNYEGIDLSIFLDQEDQMLENRDYITCGMGLSSLYKDDKYALIVNNDRSLHKLFDLSKDPNWDENISDANSDICDELFNKIKTDAKGDLLLKFRSKMGALIDWYLQQGRQPGKKIKQGQKYIY